ncbi:hypothetical protein E4U23_001260 [Claviceps purpurea]|nr:hypothetical protein E4U23_001260 [Claviceps purpurea]
MRLLPDVPQGDDDNAPADPRDSTPNNGNAPRDVCETTHSIQEEDVSTSEVFDGVDALEHTETDMADVADSAVTESKTLHVKEGGSYPFKYDAQVSKVGTQRFAGLGPHLFQDNSPKLEDLEVEERRARSIRSTLRNRRPDLSLGNFLWDLRVLQETDHLKIISEDLQEFRTVFAVIDACCDKNTRATSTIYKFSKLRQSTSAISFKNNGPTKIARVLLV